MADDKRSRSYFINPLSIGTIMSLLVHYWFSFMPFHTAEYIFNICLRNTQQVELPDKSLQRIVKLNNNKGIHKNANLFFDKKIENRQTYGQAYISMV